LTDATLLFMTGQAGGKKTLFLTREEKVRGKACERGGKELSREAWGGGGGSNPKKKKTLRGQVWKKTKSGEGRKGPKLGIRREKSIHPQPPKTGWRGKKKRKNVENRKKKKGYRETSPGENFVSFTWGEKTFCGKKKSLHFPTHCAPKLGCGVAKIGKHA